MKYLIKESQLKKSIETYLRQMFDTDDLNYFHPEVYDEETSEVYEDEFMIEFYKGDYSEDDIYFRWYACDYFNPGSYARTICPTVVIEQGYSNQLNGFFGNLWEEPFKEWFQKNFDLPVKTVEYR